MPFWKWEGYCVKCRKVVRQPSGLFCGNFGHSRGSCTPCQRVWCGRCYIADSSVQFHIQKAENDEGVEWKRKSRSERFIVGINGAHLIQPFQCDFCWFFNLKKRFPSVTSYQDRKLLVYIRRVNLDLIWSRGDNTTYVSSFRKSLKVSLDLGLSPSYYPYFTNNLRTTKHLQNTHFQNPPPPKLKFPKLILNNSGSFPWSEL